MKRLSSDSLCPQEAPTTRAQDSSPTSPSTRTRAAPAHDDRRPHPRRTGRSGPGGLARSPRFSTARHQSIFEEGRNSAVDGRCSMVEGWPTIGPSLGPQRCKYDEPERSHRTQRREKESRETGHFFLFDLGLARFLSVASVAHRVFASQDSGNGHQLRNSSRRLLTPRKSGPASSLTHPEYNRRSAAHASKSPGVTRPEPVAGGRRVTNGTLQHDINL